MDLQLKDRKVLVTGGTRGIGRAIVEAFLAEGAQVSFCARGQEGVDQATQALGERAFGQALDITDTAALERWVNESAERMEGIDIIVPNVSALAGGPELDAWRQAFDTDLLGTVTMVNAALPWLQKSYAGSVVIISSVSGREVDIFAEPYGVLKAALIHYGKSLSRRLAAEGIRVNVVSPGNVYFADGVWGKIEREQPDLFAECLAMNPMGRMARPEEVANATVFLASGAAAFTTGTNLLVDGGLTRGVQY
ncbi:SDR family NAD(P)-dependent oxidoreductase [Azomonas macrocytogenes]|uniref:NAD(P)-dependent dehydrogenase (Short-subunit alcohol dehydrogenase family) n=1 Tax=Azomonas macrocytogenes TaxID=69962 RepID=A0A839T0F5_AZOMA|nr:SDR family oxidoreductase [Azomonas macrocytogenes]MBB3103047.1 NAD(P)-dependent dehydrogenase (short-subunit alcohol dehydrogenase family) [Azomonas macrocytogenes]